MSGSTNGKLRKRKGVTKLKVAQVEHCSIQPREKFSSNFSSIVRSRPKTPCLNSDIGKGSKTRKWHTT